VKNANPVSWFVGVVAMTSLAAGALVGCAREKAVSSMAAGVSAEPKSAGHFFPIRVGDRVVRMQLAVRSSEMQRGLMDRRDLGQEEGMLFVYDKPQSMTFWMRNTPTALDIGFFGSGGKLEEVYPMYPFDENTVASRSAELAYALEMNQGWFVRSGVKPGAALDLKALGQALKERGFSPDKYGAGAVK